MVIKSVSKTKITEVVKTNDRLQKTSKSETVKRMVLTAGCVWLIIWAISPRKSPIPCICKTIAENVARTISDTKGNHDYNARSLRCRRCLLLLGTPPRRRGTACWHRRGLHKNNNGMGARGLHAISLPTSLLDRFGGLVSLLQHVTSDVGWIVST